jgi:hypothetical protein
MPIDYEHLLSLRVRGERVTYSDRDSALYALAIGLVGGNAVPGREPLSFVAGAGRLRTVPTFAALLVPDTLLAECGWDAARVVRDAEGVFLERPLEESGTLLIDGEVDGVFDRGVDAGALVTTTLKARRERDGELLFTVRRAWLARGDGGFGGPRGAVPATSRPRAPDLVEHFTGINEQPLLFRLLADRELRHFDPDVAGAAGLPRPSLQPRCLSGIACAAILRVVCEYDHTLIRSFEARPAADAFPAEQLRIDLWQDANVVTFRVVAADRDQVVLDQGRCVLAT